MPLISILIDLICRRGLDGRACILRSLCEVTQILPDDDGFVEAMVKFLFKYVQKMDIYFR